jgi:transposase
MTSTLTPADARARLRELGPQVRDALVLTRRGRVLAGPRDLAPAAKDLLRATTAPALEAATESGAVFLARSRRHAVIVLARRGALAAPVLFGLRRVLDALEAAQG